MSTTIEQLTSRIPDGWWDELEDMQILQKSQVGFPVVYIDVYKAQWNGREVVIKTFKSSDDYTHVMSFKNETEVLKKCRECPQIVQILGTIDTSYIRDNTIYFNKEKVAYMMEYMNRRSLDKVLEDQSQVLEWPERYHITIQAAHGLAYLHGCWILHRDVKSPNILIDDKGGVKICDFGFSAFRQNQLKPFLGCSPRWIQPERAFMSEKTPPIYTEACDIFSFGIVMWEIATRKQPHSDTNTYQDIQQKIFYRLHDPLPNDCPIKYAKWVEHARAFDPKDRPSAKAIYQGLEQNLQELV